MMIAYNVLKFIGRFFYQLWRLVELFLLILPIELVMRIWCALNPRVYFESLRIKGVTEGTVEKKDDVFFIFVLYSKHQLPKFTENGLDAIARSPHNLIVVTNLELAPLVKAKVIDKCHKLIERRNIGRDFGAYKDGVNFVLQNFPDAQRIVLMNDSVFFMERTLNKLIADLNGPHDFIGLTEVHQFHYHVQSFLLSFGREVIVSRTFQKFWKGYLPIATRRWTIHRGEIRLTRKITKAGFRPHILYQAAHLLPHLERRPTRDVLGDARLLPTEVRGDLIADLLPVLGHEYSSTAFSAVEAISYGVRRLQAGPARLANTEIGSISARAAGMEQVSLGILSNQIVSSISRNNQMHHGGFLFIKYLGMPLLKRDIFYRELYTLEDVHQFLSAIGEPLRDEILGDLRRSGSGAHLRGLARILYRHGSL